MPVENYIYDGQNILEETDEFGTLQASYTYEPEEYGELISQHRGGKTSYYHYDALGSTRQLTDDTETVTDSYTYNAWGETIKQSGTTTNPFRWIGNVGYYFDEETQGYYVRARYYQPQSGRWMTQDPLGFVDGSNLYLAYFVPNGIDPSGMMTKQACEDFYSVVLERDPQSKALAAELKKNKCDIPKGICVECNGGKAGGGYSDKDNSIAICYDNIKGTEKEQQGIFILLVRHEMIHALDTCKGLPPKTSCVQNLCLEVRAYSCSGQCNYEDEQERMNCIVQGAIDSTIAAGECKNSEVKKELQKLKNNKGCFCPRNCKVPVDVPVDIFPGM